MTRWMLARSLRRAPRRLALGTLGVAFPVAMLAATLLFINLAVNAMTRVALGPVQVEQRALATALDVNLTRATHQLAAVPGVTGAYRFATADVFVRTPGAPGGATARLFAVDPSYIRDHPWLDVTSGSLEKGALLGQSLHDYSPSFGSAPRVSIEIPGIGKPALSLRAAGTIDLRRALPTWFAIPAGDVQGDVALVPRAIVIPYDDFQRKLLPQFIGQLGLQTPVLNPGLSELPPLSLEAHVAVDHSAYPSDPATAQVWSGALRRVLERHATKPGTFVVADNADEPLLEAAGDATNAKILFLLLGIPGALVAAALGLAAQSALAEAQRREDGLLRLRGATESQLARLAAAQTAIAGAIGSALGLALGFAAISALEGTPAWRDVSGGSLTIAIFAAIGLGAAITCVRLVLLVRASRRAEVVAERRLLERGWRPVWMRNYLDLVAIGIGLAILVVNALTGGLQRTTIDPSQSSTLGLSFYVLLAPIALWIGLTLLAVRLVIVAARWRTMPDRGGQLTSWRAAGLRWFGRRPARTSIALVLGILAVAFGTQVLAFVATYGSAKQDDAAANFGADLRLTPGDPLDTLPENLSPDVASVSPIREVPVRAESDRKTVMAIDFASYPKTATVTPRMISGAGLASLQQDTRGVLVAQEIATDFAVGPGDNLPLTFFPDDQDLSRNLTLHVVGVFQSFPPSNPYAEMVMTTAGLPSYLISEPDFYIGHVAPGHSPGSVATELTANAAVGPNFSVTTLDQQVAATPHTLAALNLDSLNRIEAIGAALIAAIGVAVLGAFLVFERRREFAIMEAVGADTSQVVTIPAQEGLIAVVGSLAIGIPLGLLLGILSVRVLSRFFTLPPPLITVPLGTLIPFVLLMLVTSLIAIGGALIAVTKVHAAAALREP